MSKKLLCLMSFVLVLAMASTGSAGLEGYWPFDGDPNDASGNGLHGTLMGDPAPVFVDGVIGQALDTTEGNGPGYVELTGYQGIEGGDAFSIAMWINTSDDEGTMMAWGSTAGGSTRVEFRVWEDRLRCESSGNVQGDTTLPDNEWIHVAVTVKEDAIISEPDVTLYLNGQVDNRISTGGSAPLEMAAGHDVTIARRHSGESRWFDGLIDDVQLYSRELSAEQVQEVMDGGFPQWPKADKPDPADGAILNEASAVLSWRSGTTAVAHDVYFGTSPDLGPDQLVSPQQTDAQYEAAGLVPDQTYYWRVDETDADGVVATGDVQSFSTAPRSAYAPSPSDGQRLLDTAVALSWAAGWNPIMHQVYFGTDAGQVVNATDAPLVADIGYDPGPLEPGTTYYWRVDEFYGTDTVKGAVWSFSTVPVLPVTDDPNLLALWTFDSDSGGVALDQSGNTNHAVLRNGAQIVQGHGGDVLDLGAAGYAAISNLNFNADTSPMAEVTVSAWIRTDDEGSQYIISFDRDENFRLAVGPTYAPAGEGQVGWHVMTLQDGAESMLDYASVMRVDDGQWHHVAGVFDNGTSTIYIDGFAEPSATGGPVYGTGATGTSHTPRYGLIGANSEATSFDGSNSGGPPLQGEMDDLAIYDRAFSEDEMRQLYGNLMMAWQPQPEMGASVDIVGVALSWTPGDGAIDHFVYVGTDPDAVAAADVLDTTGVYRGYQTEASYVVPGLLEFGTTYYWRVDESVFSEGKVVLAKGRVWQFSTNPELVIYDTETPFDYDTSVDPFVSEVALDLDPAQNWTEPFGRLAVSYTGLADNAAAPMSLVLTDASGASAAVLNPDPNAALQTDPTDLVVTFADFAVDISAIVKVSMVIGDLDAPAPGGTGSLTIHNVRLLGIQKPVGHWMLDGNADDSSATGADGTVVGDPAWVAGVLGEALELDGVDDFVDCGNPPELDFGTGDFAISAWVRLSTTERATVYAKGGDNGGGIRYTLAMGEANDDRMTLTTDDDSDKRQTLGATVVNDGAWHHVVGMRSGNTGLVYVDGVLDGTQDLPDGYDLSGSSQHNALIGAITSHTDGSLEKFFTGTIDDVRVYDRALTDGEIAKLAGL